MIKISVNMSTTNFKEVQKQCIGSRYDDLFGIQLPMQSRQSKCFSFCPLKSFWPWFGLSASQKKNPPKNIKLFSSLIFHYDQLLTLTVV